MMIILIGGNKTLNRFIDTLLFLIVATMLMGCAVKFMYGIEFEATTDGNEIEERTGKDDGK